MVVSAGVNVAFPLAFVAGRTRLLPAIGLAALTLQVPLAWAAAALAGLDGLALALTASTGFVLAFLLRELGALDAVERGLARAALTVGLLAATAFLPPALLLPPVAAAPAGVLVYAVLLAALRPSGLRSSWGYLRALR
jgi:hypothetical protein